MCFLFCVFCLFAFLFERRDEPEDSTPSKGKLRQELQILFIPFSQSPLLRNGNSTTILVAYIKDCFIKSCFVNKSLKGKNWGEQLINPQFNFTQSFWGPQREHTSQNLITHKDSGPEVFLSWKCGSETGSRDLDNAALKKFIRDVKKVNETSRVYNSARLMSSPSLFLTLLMTSLLNRA